MNIIVFVKKAKGWLGRHFVNIVSKTPFYHYIFKSYWHYLFYNSDVENCDASYFYYGARPNQGAGIGHQMANWIDGLYWSKRFGLHHVHFPFSTEKWDYFLGFKGDDPTVMELKKKGYKLRQLPSFRDENEEEISLVKRIMASYSGQKVIFWPPQDHPYFDQYPMGDDLRARFLSSPSRKDDDIIYDSSKFNVAIHVRRTVIIDGKAIHESEEARARRWLSNDYYERVLKQVLEHIRPSKPIAIFIFSTGRPEEFKEFKKYGEVRFCSDMDEYQSFAHLVFADLLITSKSSFSYKPAIISSGIKVCPGNFWHGYPKDNPNWILCDNNGDFDFLKLERLFN